MLFRSLLLGCSFVALSVGSLTAMPAEEDGDDGHHLSNFRRQNPSAVVNDPQEEARHFHRLQDFVKEKLNSPTLRPVVDDLMDVWTQNQPSATITDETQIRERAQQRARVLEQLKDFYEPLKAGMEPARLAEIYQQLFGEPNQTYTVLEKKRMILRHSAVFFASGMSRKTRGKKDRDFLIKAFLTGDAAQIQAISQNAGILFTPNMHIRTYYEVVSSAFQVVAREIGPRATAISQNAGTLFTNMSDDDRADIIKALLTGDAAQIQAICQNAESLFSPDMPGSYCAAVITAALQIDAAEIGLRATAISQNAGTLFRPTMFRPYRHKIIAALLKGDVTQIQMIAQNAETLFPPNMDGEDNIIAVALQVNAAEIGRRAAAIAQNVGTLFTPNMDHITRCEIIKAALQINAAEIGPRVTAISQNAGTLFSSHLNDYNRAKIIAAALQVDAAEIGPRTDAIFFQNAEMLFPPNMTVDDCVNTTIAAFKVNAAEISPRAIAIFQNGGSLFTPDMSSHNLFEIITAALKIDAAEIGRRVAAISQNAGSLFTSTMSSDVRAMHITVMLRLGLEAVLDVSALEWDTICCDSERREVYVSFLRNENPFRDKIKAAFEDLILDENFQYRAQVIGTIVGVLGEDHPIAQEFIQLGLGMENQHDPNSFLAVHQEMLAKRGQTVLHKPRVMDNGVTFNTAMTKEPRPRGDAKLILKSQWKQMVTDLEAFSTQHRNAFQDLGLELPSDLQGLKENDFLLGLLNEENSFRVSAHISVVSYQFREILTQILGLSRGSEDDKVAARLLLAQLLSSIEYCRTGKSDGISQTYRLLRNEKMLEEEEIGTERFSAEIQAFFQDEFRRMREGAIARVVDIVCPPGKFTDDVRVHGKAYVKGILGEDFGTYFKGEKPSIDMNGNCVPSVLRQKSKQELLDLAYLYYKPEDAMDRVHRMLNNGQISIEGRGGDVLTVAILNMYLSYEKRLDSAYTVFEEDGVTPRGLTPQAAQEILLKTGIFVNTRLGAAEAGG